MKPINNRASPGITTNEALKIAKEQGFSITRATLIKWIQEYEIAKKVFGRWYIDKRGFLFYLKYGEDPDRFKR